ncbi:hypothetical protein [Micromonospora saelicesensis]|uniref:hypothetical protein n=1 Tax=Micromonospora saelicesensis TaxID=285676 RepID=UPI0015EBC5D7|nr:hypothetical protein [Micromonospora saelicesensis]
MASPTRRYHYNQDVARSCGLRSAAARLERSTAKAGEVLELTEPVGATIRPEDLLA